MVFRRFKYLYALHQNRAPFVICIMYGVEYKFDDMKVPLETSGIHPLLYSLKSGISGNVLLIIIDSFFSVINDVVQDILAFIFIRCRNKKFS